MLHTQINIVFHITQYTVSSIYIDVLIYGFVYQNFLEQSEWKYLFWEEVEIGKFSFKNVYDQTTSEQKIFLECIRSNDNVLLPV